MTDAVIRVLGVSKRFPGSQTLALDNVTFHVARGETYGVLGADGSGKTTLFRILAGLLAPTSGRAYVTDLDVVRNRGSLGEVLGYVPQRAPLPLKRTIADVMEFWARADGLRASERRDRIRTLLASLHLEARGDARVVECTSYEQRLLYLAVARIRDPPILLLDEPMTGLSPADRASYQRHCGTLREEGKTIVLSAPDLPSLQSVCGRILTIAAGRAVRPYDTADLLAIVGEARHARVFVELDGSPSGAIGVLQGVPGVIEAVDTGSSVLLLVQPARFSEDVARMALEGAGMKVKSLRAADIVLNDIVRTLVRRESR